MKKISLLLSLLTGILSFAQSTPLFINNFSSYNAVGRLQTLNPNTSSIQMIGAPNLPNTSFTIPANGFTHYNSFDTAGTALYPILRWYVYDSVNPANSGNYVYNDPFITTINTLNEWAGFNIVLFDPAINDNVDAYAVGDNSLSSFFNYSVSGAHSSADWFTITTPSGAITYLEIFEN